MKMNNDSVENFYQERIAQFNLQLKQVKQQLRRIAGLRLSIVLGMFVLLYTTWNKVEVPFLLAEAVVCIGLFLFVVSKDTDAKEKAAHLQRLLFINEEEIKILHHNFSHRETGAEHLPPHHPYAEDLDLFGNASLYQYINRCTTQQGKQLLSKRLLYPSTKNQIHKEQEAVTELKNKTDFIQQLQAIGTAKQLTSNTQNKVEQWRSSPSKFRATHWRWLAVLFPIFTIAFVFLYITNVVTASLFGLMVFVCYLIAFYISSKVSPTYELLSKISGEIQTLQRVLQTIEAQNFASAKLVHLQKLLQNQKGNSTSTEIKKLHSILNRFDVRLNTFLFFFLNTFLLWDLQQLLALNKWKQANEQNITEWFTAIAEIEVSNSLATLFFNHPSWCMPVIADDFFTLNGSEIAHPLLPEQSRVANDFSLEGKGKIAVVTGSNMGGKSTFLRSIGVNAVLALMGAPVCASQFIVSVVKLMSSMRIADNLSENTSTFYAELKKLKSIIEAVNEHQAILILLDEILRGTNSLDRHTGSVALLKQLIQKDAVAIVATHDVELAQLKEIYPQAIQNYHFDVQASGNELYFDYKLKEGICTSLNASILMKNIGIEME